MDPALFAVSFVCYGVLVFTLKRLTYPKSLEPSPPFPTGWKTGHEYAIALSPDYWWAKRFKSRINQFQPEQTRQLSLKRYVVTNNLMNFWVSVALTILLFLIHATVQESIFFQLILATAVIRYISRSFEIAYAFGLDVIDKSKNTTGLDKFERIKLALVSYAEIFIYSAAGYMALPAVKDPLEAIVASLSVGTFANVGFVFPDRNGLLCNSMVFIQIFATLGLVVLSLASYVSREE